MAAIHQSYTTLGKQLQSFRKTAEMRREDRASHSYSKRRKAPEPSNPTLSKMEEEQAGHSPETSPVHPLSAQSLTPRGTGELRIHNKKWLVQLSAEDRY